MYTQNRCIRVVARLVAGIHLPDLLEGNHCRANAQQNWADCQRGDGDGTDLQVEEKLMNCQHKKRLPDLKMFVECLVRETLDFFELCYNYYHIREQTAFLLVGLPEDYILGIGEERLLLPAKRRISQDERNPDFLKMNPALQTSQAEVREVFSQCSMQLLW